MAVDFPRLSELPYDIRVLVWYHTAHERRVVRLTRPMIGCHFHGSAWMLRPTTRPPALLGTCRESRHVGLRHYEAIHQRCCQGQERGGRRCDERDHSGRIIYFNNDADTIRGNIQFSSYLCEHIPNIRWLQLDSQDSGFSYWVEFGVQFIEGPLLESVVFFHDGRITSWRTEIAEPAHAFWGCPQKIIKVIGRDGETWDLKKDIEYLRSLGGWATDPELESDTDEDA